MGCSVQCAHSQRGVHALLCPPQPLCSHGYRGPGALCGEVYWECTLSVHTHCAVHSEYSRRPTGPMGEGVYHGILYHYYYSTACTHANTYSHSPSPELPEPL